MAKKKQKKRKKKTFTRFLFQLSLIFAGCIGWYYTENLKGVFISMGSFLLFWILVKIWWKIRGYFRLRKAGIKQIDEMTGEEFEAFLGRLFKKRGFKVTYTKTSGDYGADLILQDRENTIAVQAKRYSGAVGVKAVQEVIGALKMYNATEAWVVTNSYFTKQAQKLAESNDVYLIDRDDLIEIILDSK
ncbi:restriction endonuclease [Ureibacillus terrenus]|uniref:restriction endonuclease n=1 Tax=Ureibacillus terrenus TaxID=118246 RepID=UPI002E1AF11A|nr:restriction endonuclease [Ureibacillus terrenus]